MTDRELLELAAKAAGLRYTKPTDDYSGSLGLALCDEHGRDVGAWSPLNDDGDAFRLAVKLRLHIEWRADGRVAVSPQNETLEIYSMESSRENSQENARRAIVRAAADIGAEKPSA